MWTGLGLNYRAIQANWAADKAYLKSVKAPGSKMSLRMGVAMPIPYVSGSYFDQVTYFSDNDFQPVVNLYGAPFNTHTWPNVHDAIVACAADMQSKGITCEIQLANELEGNFGLVFAATSLSQTGGLATFTSSSSTASWNNFQTGDLITIYNAGNAYYNGTFPITAINQYTFTYAVDPAAPASTGGAQAISMSLHAMNDLICQLATDVKAVYSLGPISYACYDNGVNGFGTYDDWIARGPSGLGGLDYLSIHIYPGVKNTAGAGYVLPLPTDVAPIVAALGSKVYCSEFNISGSSTSITLTPLAGQLDGMRNLYKSLRNLGLQRLLVWAWDGNQDADNKFAMKFTDGSFSPMWDVLLNDNKRRSFSP